MVTVSRSDGECSVPDQPGEIWPMDRQGRAKNAAGRTQLRPAARRAAGLAAQAYLDRLDDEVHSVYLTGPAARGRMGPFRAFGVLRLTAAPHGEAWLQSVAGAIRSRWPNAGIPELSLLPWRDVFPADDTFSLARFRIGVNSLCIAGRDLGRSVAPQHPSTAAANAWIISAASRVADAEARLTLAGPDTDIAHEAESLARFLLETGFALVMSHEGVYTEDLDLQRDLFSLNYPELADAAELAHEFCICPPTNAVDALKLVQDLGRWMIGEADRWLDTYNPARVHALPA